MVSALDDWARVRRDRRLDRVGAARFAAAARARPGRAARPTSRRPGIGRQASQADGAARSRRLAERSRTPAVCFDLLGTALLEAGERDRAGAVLQIGRRHHPRDVWLNYDLARALDELGKRQEAIRYYVAARAIRPETGHELAHALELSGDGDEAIAVFRDLVILRPDDGRHLCCWGRSLRTRGQTAEATRVLARAEAALRASPACSPETPSRTPSSASP